MASKVQMIKFNKTVEKIVLSLGGVPDTFYKWVIETKAGKLMITVHEPRASKLFSIFCRFEDPMLANEILSTSNRYNLNPNSGKWNYHFSNMEDCLKIFENSIKAIETETEITEFYDLRIGFSAEVTGEERIARAIRDCFNRHKGKLKKGVMDATIKAVGNHTPLYKTVWEDFKKTFEIKTIKGEYVNPFYVD